MPYRVALVGMSVSGQGPWIRSTGMEVGVRITHLLPGEKVKMHTRPANGTREFATPGEFPWPLLDRVPYMFEKHTEGEGAPTIVEVKFR